MSFILDALKKSETERQQQAGGEFSNVPSRSGEEQPFKWLWILGFLLAVNFAVLLGILMRNDDEPPPGMRAPEQAEPQPAPLPDATGAAPDATFEEQVAAARENQPPPVAEETVASSPVEVDTGSAESTPAPAPRAAATILPTFDELRVNGVLQLPDLHLDIHVYAEEADERFVFINMSKQRENTTLEEGPVVREITPDGVVLEYRGSTFLLPRE